MIAQFSLRLLAGISLMWCLMPRREVTTGFFRIQMLVALGLAVLSALTISLGDSSTTATWITPTIATVTCGILAALAYAGSVFWMLARRGPGDLIVHAVALGSTALLLVQFPLAGGAAPTWLRVVSELSSALLLGSAMTGMLLGHWYLTAPTMSIAPLSRLNALFGGAGALRLAVSAAALALAEGSELAGTAQMWLALRWIAGILGPLVLAVMVWRILKYRNTQAATGVLFVGVILTFIGELCAMLLERTVGMPL